VSRASTHISALRRESRGSVPRACRRRPAASSHSRRTSTTRSTLRCRRRALCSRTTRCPTALASTAARRARALAALLGPSPRRVARAGGVAALAFGRQPTGPQCRGRTRRASSVGSTCARLASPMQRGGTTSAAALRNQRCLSLRLRAAAAVRALAPPRPIRPASRHQT
jgi:hypothetical protein